MEWMDILEKLLVFIAGGGVVKLFTLGAVRRQENAEAEKASAEAEKTSAEGKDIALESLENTIKELSAQHAATLSRESEKDALIEKLMNDLADKRCECTTKGYYMCIHQGCVLRRPSLGRGKQYFKEHEKEEDFGADFYSVDELMKEYKSQINNTANV